MGDKLDPAVIASTDQCNGLSDDTMVLRALPWK
jgi:hypothetical protein